MANPQKENGHIDIANEIAEKLAMYRISGQEYQILWVIWRKTWGWHKKEDIISFGQIEKATRMKRRQVIRAIQSLIGKNIITSVKRGTCLPNTLMFQKDFDKWTASVNKDTSVKKDTIASVNKDTKTSVNDETHKRKKETITKEIYSGVPPHEVQSFINLFKTINPSYQRLFGNKTEISCSARLIKQHGYEKMERTLIALPDILGQPYAPRITTPYELEKNLGKLLQFVQQHNNITNNKKADIAFI